MIQKAPFALEMSQMVHLKYRKSWPQYMKERRRRDAVFEMVVAPGWIRRREMAERLGVSRATVQRDLRRLRRRLDRYWMDKKVQGLIRTREVLEGLSWEERLRRLALVAGWEKPKGAPRGKPFSSSYQPRWGRYPEGLGGPKNSIEHIDGAPTPPNTNTTTNDEPPRASSDIDPRQPRMIRGVRVRRRRR